MTDQPTINDISDIAMPVELPPIGEQPLLKLDLGCGQRCQPGFTGVDLYGDPAIKFDLMTFPWTFAEDDSVDEVWCSHFFEHVPGPTRIPFMDELWRIMKIGAKATFITPYWSSMRAVQDPTHAWPPVCEASYLYFDRNWREQNMLTHYLGKCNFSFGYGHITQPEVGLWNQERRDHAIGHEIGWVNDLQVVLTKLE